MEDLPPKPLEYPQPLRRKRSLLRPDSCKRVTFALGRIAQDRNERLVKILACHELVSKASVVRGLLRFAEEMALASGDPMVASVINVERDRQPEYHYDPKTDKMPVLRRVPGLQQTDPEASRIWEKIIDEILKEYTVDERSFD
jgi:hypothetical protein